MASAISALTQRIADSMDLLNLPRVGAAFIGMWTLHFAADRVFRWVFGERVVGKLSRKDRLHMDEKVCSTLNSVQLSLCSLLVVFRDKEFRGPGAVFDRFPNLGETMFSNYLGYVVYDAIVMHLQGGEHWTMWLHHAMGISGAVTILTQRRLVYFPVFFGLTELTAFTTNMLWYVQKIYPLYLAEYHPATDSQQKTNGHGNPTTSSTSFSSRSAHLTSDPRAVKLLSRTLFMRAASFFLCRVWVFPYVVYYAVNNVGGWSNFVDRFSQEAFIVKALTISNVTLMGSLNFIWTFWITMKWWGFEKRRRAAEKKGESVRYVNEADEFDQREHEITENLLDKEAKDKSK